LLKLFKIKLVTFSERRCRQHAKLIAGSARTAYYRYMYKKFHTKMLNVIMRGFCYLHKLQNVFSVVLQQNVISYL